MDADEVLVGPNCGETRCPLPWNARALAEVVFTYRSGYLPIGFQRGKSELLFLLFYALSAVFLVAFPIWHPNGVPKWVCLAGV